jgi:hypothetical protein
LNFILFLNENKIPFKLITAEKYNSKINIFQRFFIVLRFFLRGNLSTLFQSGTVMCFESISVIGLCVSNVFNHRQKLLMHYHEYFSIEEYRGESFLEFLGYKLEGSVLKKALWISHTNDDRLNLWAKDNSNINPLVLKVFPNYPPSIWKNSNREIINQINKIRLVHIGSLSIDSMYLNEVLSHFGSNSSYSIDFYSHKFSQDVRDAIELHDNCKINGAIDYENIPKLKGLFDVGLVLYKGLSLNFKYNAPNKIFEYLALDLDVWCSDKLISAKRFERLNCYPKMIMVDYTAINQFDVERARSKVGLAYSPTPYTCETVFNEILAHLT